MFDREPVSSRATALSLSLIVALMAWRVVFLAFDPPNLSFDEAQYWAWAQTIQLGYYSKPPVVAWVIAATTGLFGDGEGAVKLGSTLAHGGTALVLLALGNRLWGRSVGAWSAVGWITMPAVSLSSLMITTDPFLLFFWAAGLLALVEAPLAGGRWNRWWAVLGVSFGLGLLSKYAMLFFPIGLLLWMAWDKEGRRLARQPGLWLGFGLGLLIYAPNLIWNATNGFVSYLHTKDNANLSHGTLFHPGKLAEFLGGQFGVFGPVLMAALVVALAAALRRGSDSRMRMMASFCLPVLVVMTVESVLSRANANWTAPAFVSGTVLVSAYLATRAQFLLKLSLALHLLAAATLADLDGVRALLRLPDSAKWDPEKRLKAWDDVGARVSDVLAAHPGARLLADERKVLATLIYYVRPHPFDAVKWNPSGVIHDYFDQTTALSPGPGTWIYVTEQTTLAAGIAASFDHAEKVVDIRVPIHPDYVRAVTVWRLDGFRGYGK